MAHMHGVVHRLRETAGDRLRYPEQTIQQLRSEERIMNKIVPHPVDVRIYHQRINEPENQHHPQRRMRKQKVQPEKIREMKKPRRYWNSIPACVCEELGIRRRAFYSDRVSSHSFIALRRSGT